MAPAGRLGRTCGVGNNGPMTNPYEEQQPQAQPSPQTPYPQSGQTPNPQSGQSPYPQSGQTPYPQSGQSPYPQSGQSPYPPAEQYQPAGQPASYGQPYTAPPVQEHPQGTLILIFGILGIFVTIFAPIAWYLGNKAKREIQTSGVHYSNEQNISVGRMLGKIFTILAIVWIAFVIIWVIIAVIAAGGQG